MLNSKWIDLAGQLGYDLVCYKTIRSDECPGHGLPNVIFVDAKEQLNPKKLPDHLVQRKDVPHGICDIAITNSFGMPSRSRKYLQSDIPAANAALARGQVMIVSIVGTPGKGEFIDDFVETARFAKACGAKIVEANFSCPNVKTGEGDICSTPDAAYTITCALVKALGNTPLIIKVGAYADKRLHQQIMLAIARGGARAISGINTISMKVVNSHGQAALGQED